VQVGVVFLGNARGTLHHPLGEGGKVGGGNDTAKAGHGMLPGSERLKLFIIVTRRDRSPDHKKNAA
jgi:hypothetical protein